MKFHTNLITINNNFRMKFVWHAFGQFDYKERLFHCPHFHLNSISVPRILKQIDVKRSAILFYTLRTDNKQFCWMKILIKENSYEIFSIAPKTHSN